MASVTASSKASKLQIYSSGNTALSISIVGSTGRLSFLNTGTLGDSAAIYNPILLDGPQILYTTNGLTAANPDERTYQDVATLFTRSGSLITAEKTQRMADINMLVDRVNNIVRNTDPSALDSLSEILGQVGNTANAGSILNRLATMEGLWGTHFGLSPLIFTSYLGGWTGPTGGTGAVDGMTALDHVSV